jgi:hypothetical protein
MNMPLILVSIPAVFAQHLQDGAYRTESTNDIPNDPAPPNLTDFNEEPTTLGPPNFSWDGSLFSTIDPDFADANQLWLWSDSTLENFL